MTIPERTDALPEWPLLAETSKCQALVDEFSAAVGAIKELRASADASGVPLADMAGYETASVRAKLAAMAAVLQLDRVRALQQKFEQQHPEETAAAKRADEVVQALVARLGRAKS